MNRSLLVLVLAELLATSLQGQTFLRGKIIDKETGQPIAYANVSVLHAAGTAADENGKFLLKINSEQLHQRLNVSCIGYASSLFSVDSLLKANVDQLQIYLEPFTLVLEEVNVQASKIGAADIASEAIKEIPHNYIQQPFNMEFYSTITVKDSIKTYYLVETIVDTYRQGYVAGAENYSKMLQKRTSGESPLAPAYDKKRNINYFQYERIPFFNIFLVDMIGVGSKYDYTIFNPDYFKKLDFRQKGISFFEGDTVNVIEYRPKGGKRMNTREGSLFISNKNLAILKHTRKIGQITLEVNYRKWGNYYFPYFIKTTYPTSEKNNSFEVVFEAYIKKINTEHLVDHTGDSMKDWHLSDVPYNESYWNDNYPAPK